MFGVTGDGAAGTHSPSGAGHHHHFRATTATWRTYYDRYRFYFNTVSNSEECTKWTMYVHGRSVRSQINNDKRCDCEIR